MNRNYFIKRPTVEGFDTETYHGNIKLITSSENYKEPKNFSDVISFLWYNGKELNFFYNIGFDFSVIAKMYLLENPDKAKDFRELKYAKFKDFSISFVSGKGFSIKLGKRRKRYFDISQFYNDGYHRTLDEVSKSVLGKGKNAEELELDRKLIGEQEGYYEKHRNKIIKYGMKDAELTKRLSELKIDEIYKFLGVYPIMWYSSASISKAYLELHHKDEKWVYWDLVEKNKDLHYYVYESYFGGIFLSRKIGYVQDVSEIDINSAYPYAITHLYSLVNAKAKKVLEPSRDCDYGFYHIRIKYNGLIPYRTKTNIIYPISLTPIETIMTGIEYNYWKDKTEIEFIDGFEIITEKKLAFPEYADIYRERQKIKKDKSLSAQMKQWNLKIILNATYGAFAQSKGGFTYWTNFIYASYITAITRLKIYEGIEKIGYDNVISILTDSIVFHNADWNLPDSNTLGDFKLEFRDKDMITYMSGLYAYESEILNEHTLGFEIPYMDLKKRGFPSLKAHDIKGNSNILEVQRTKVRKLLESIIQKKIETIGDFFPDIKKIDLKSNLQKYDFPTEKLTFDYLNNNTLIGNSILVSQSQTFKAIDWNQFKNFTKTLNKIKKYIRKRQKHERQK